MAARVVAQVLIAGATVVFRAATQAWGQALVNAQKSGVAQEAATKATGAVAGAMNSSEARLILGLDTGATWEEVMKKYKHLFSVNETQGSFYLTSKVYRAKEALEQEYEQAGLKTDIPEEPQAQAQGSEQKEQK